MADVGESLDFDFFDSPRSPDATRLSKTGKSPSINRPQSAKPPSSPARRNQCKPSSPSPSSRDSSLSDISDSEQNATREESSRGRKAQRSPSISSLSSSDRSHSASHSDRSRSISNDSIDSERYSDSKYSSNSDNDSKKIKKAGKKTTDVPRRQSSRLGKDEHSSSAYSEDDSDNIVQSKNTPPRKNNTSIGKPENTLPSGSNKQAWGGDKHSNSYRARPTTAKNRSSGSDRQQQRNEKSRLGSGNLSSTNSDMTDVSPIESPRSDISGSVNHSGSRHKFRAMPIPNSDLNVDSTDYSNHKSGLDLEILMKAVDELEKQKRLKANSRRVMFAPVTLKRSSKSNYTFDKNQTRDIERENQRLLKEIVQQVHANERKKQQRFSPANVYKLTASAVNRDREMKRIENENRALLKRLQKVKPTKTIARENQIHAYENMQLHGVPIGSLHPMPRKKASLGHYSVIDDSSSLGSRTRSMTSIHSGTSSVRSRPNSRPCSATKRLDTRPVWSDRW